MLESACPRSGVKPPSLGCPSESEPCEGVSAAAGANRSRYGNTPNERVITISAELVTRASDHFSRVVSLDPDSYSRFLDAADRKVCCGQKRRQIRDITSEARAQVHSPSQSLVAREARGVNVGGPS